MTQAIAETIYAKAITAAQKSFEEIATQTGLNWRTESVFALQAIQGNDVLTQTANGNPFSLRMAMVNVASIGLSLNPVKQHAFLVGRDGKIILDISYRGLIQIAAESGSIKWAKAELVYKEDSFTYHGPAKTPDHECDPFSKDRGELRGVYCLAETCQGQTLVETIPISEVWKIRDMSADFQNGYGAWISFETELIKKVAIKRASKTWPLVDVRMHQAIYHLNTEAGEGLASMGGKNNAERKQLIVSDEEVHDTYRNFVFEVVERAGTMQAWKAADDLLKDRLDGRVLAWALDKLSQASKANAA